MMNKEHLYSNILSVPVSLVDEVDVFHAEVVGQDQAWSCRFRSFVSTGTMFPSVYVSPVCVKTYLFGLVYPFFAIMMSTDEFGMVFYNDIKFSNISF